MLLAQALFGNPQALLLDEPTNHLDLDSVHWLQDFLSRYEGALIVISHDRHFLNSVCTHIADIDYETIITYTGGYDDMVLAKTQIRSRIEAQNAQREKKIAQLNEFIARFSAGTRSSQVTSRKKEVERLQTSELAQSNIQRPLHPLRDEAPVGPASAGSQGRCRNLTATLQVINGFQRPAFQRGEKIALMGRNGAGKTTLLKSLLRNAHRRSVETTGSCDFDSMADSRCGDTRSRSATSRRITRNRSERHDGRSSGCTQFDPQASQEELRGLLGQMLFSGDDALKPTEALSGGEAARLIFCRLMLQKPNFLVLDEPTNHLDLESINALNIALQKYEGTVLLVTHDHDLIDEVATRIWHFGADGASGGNRERPIIDFAGAYAEYEAPQAVR